MKKGFTLVEMIISILLVALIGTLFTTTYFNVKSNKDKMNNDEKILQDALQVYLSANNIYNNINDNYEGAIVSLKTLEKEGLITTGLNPTNDDNFNYESEYFVVALADTVADVDCSNGVEFKSFNSWHNADDVVYFCKSSGSNKNLKQQLIESDNNFYVAKGANPANWVEFQIYAKGKCQDSITDTTTVVAWPCSNKWRILDIASDGTMRLVLTTNIVTNNDNNLNKSKSRTCNGRTYYQLNDDSEYYIVSSGTEQNWLPNDLGNTGEKSKLVTLKNLVNSNYVIEKDYYYHYSITISNTYVHFEPLYDIKYTSTVGLLSKNDFINSYFANESWLKSYSTIIGYGSTHFNGNSVSYAAGIKNGSLSHLDYYRDSCIRCYDYGKGFPFIPVVTLKSNITLANDKNCDTNKLGTEECPYTLVSDGSI